MKILKSAVAALLLGISATFPASAQQHDLDDLFAALKQADEESSHAIIGKIWAEWSKSGSPAMDFLLERGRKMMEEGKLEQAVDHLSALIDHAPEFAEAYNARATAFFQQKRLGEALSDIRSTLALNPRHFGAMAGLATIQEELGYEAEALATWRAVKEINPTQENADESIRRLTVIAEGVET
ncbi:tetratricopeptide repeat protein [Oceaniglobus roseus]|uniref:tetratricopeptide repeat protein n=1 Tax=Oceaniglobus roseus TaxID=1737570 RepID=UPI001FE926C2|nr:hypothetical protein [Kandeliimicrobium roseum]